MPELTWQKSTYSAEAANCVQVAVTHHGVVHLRESDQPEVVLTSTPSGIRTLIRALKDRPNWLQT